MRLPPEAPPWLSQFAREVEDTINQSSGIFVSRKPLTIATLPTASRFLWKLAMVSDGAANKFVVISNGTAWYYMEGTAV